MKQKNQLLFQNFINYAFHKKSPQLSPRAFLLNNQLMSLHLSRSRREPAEQGSAGVFVLQTLKRKFMTSPSWTT